jgi:AmmeMemoRadiSam system protein B/AmmeMemoRadiSam system protein A
MTVHQPVVAGMFYPGDATALRAMVQDLLARAPALDVPAPKAVILPHAGYRYSGAVAAAGVVALAPGVKRVVVLGPSHRFAFRGVALPQARAMRTPLGEVPLDADAVAALVRNPDVLIVPQAHAAEHSIEVELPFLQHRLGEFSLVPLVIGEIGTERLAEIIEALWGGDETLIVISSDLSHFLTADEAERTDLATADAIERADGAGLTGRQACGHRPLAAFLACAARRGMRITRLALTHSGAVTGEDSRVVGYGAWMAHEAEVARLSSAHRESALRLAGQSLHDRLQHGRASALDLRGVPSPLRSVAAAFVTLTCEGRLRGCVGSLAAHRALAADVSANAVRAGFEDPRFHPVTANELARADVEIALLSAAAPIAVRDEADLLARLRPGRDGLILQEGERRATFLPKVWEQLSSPPDFLRHLKRKAGLAPDHWSPDVKVWRYVAESFKGRIGPAA